MSEQTTLFDMTPFPEVEPALRNINPCVALWGLGPEDKKCATCAFLFAKHYDKTYYKCRKRSNTNAPGTDHRVRFPACAKYEERQ